MRKIVLTYGLIAGGIMAAMLLVSGLLMGDGNFAKYGMAFGYASMLLAFTLIFFAIRTYRQQNDNTISFGRGVGIGMLIVLISGILYVIGWAFIYHFIVPDFLDKLAAGEIARLQEAKASAEEIVQVNQQIDSYREMYSNPITFSLITFIEPLPPGILVTLISALILRKKKVVVG